jgi:hypothetical protein
MVVVAETVAEVAVLVQHAYRLSFSLDMARKQPF